MADSDAGSADFGKAVRNALVGSVVMTAVGAVGTYFVTSRATDIQVARTDEHLEATDAAVVMARRDVEVARAAIETNRERIETLRADMAARDGELRRDLDNLQRGLESQAGEIARFHSMAAERAARFEKIDAALEALKGVDAKRDLEMLRMQGDTNKMLSERSAVADKAYQEQGRAQDELANRMQGIATTLDTVVTRLDSRDQEFRARMDQRDAELRDVVKGLVDRIDYLYREVPVPGTGIPYGLSRIPSGESDWRRQMPAGTPPVDRGGRPDQ